MATVCKHQGREGRCDIRIIKVAIVGSRDYPHLDFVRAIVQQIHRKYPNAIIVSGGARGVDRAAEEEARRLGMRPPKVFLADWNAHGRAAGMLRNSEIVAESEIVLAFWDGRSRGTLDTITKAQAAGKRVFVYDLHKRLTTP